MLHMFSTAPKPATVRNQSSGEHGRRIHRKFTMSNPVRASFRAWLISVHSWLLKGIWSSVGNTNNYSWSMRSPLYLQACFLGSTFLCRLHMCPADQSPAQSSYNHHQLHTSACWNIPRKTLEEHVQWCSQHRTPGDSSAVMVPPLPHRPEGSHHFLS